jgi:NADPH2:quinone reductase
MFAAMTQEYGPPEVLRTVEVADPVPAPGAALVEVRAADVLWVETAVRRGEGQA